MSNQGESVLVGALQKFSIEDGPGIRTTVFLKGCPLNCKWCHNPEMINAKQELIQSPNNCIGCGACVDICPKNAIRQDFERGVTIDRSVCDMCLKCTEVCNANALRPVAESMTIKEILDIAKQDEGFYKNTDGGITISGGEILTHSQFVKSLIDEAAKLDINVCLDTSGYGNPNDLLEMALKENVTDILYDIKSLDDEVHKEYMGVSNKLILDNLRMLVADVRTRDKLIMRMPLIRGINDGVNTINKTGKLFEEIGVKRVDLLPYHSLGISKERNIGGMQKVFEQPTEERIAEIENYFRNEKRLDVRILGRV